VADLGRLSERDSSGGERSEPYQADAKRRRRYERSEPRIARREPQKKPPKGGFFCVRSGSPKGILLRKIQLKIKN
jgi:hypothetical protein